MNNPELSPNRTCSAEMSNFKEACERLNLMRSSQIFANLPSTECLPLAREARHQGFSRSAVLFSQGQKIERVFLLVSGSVKLTQVNSRGDEVILALRGSREMIDVPAGPKFREHAYTASVVSNCTALTWRASRMQDMLQEHPILTTNVISTLVEDMRRLQQRYHEISCDKVERCVASTLIRLVEEYGRPTSEGTSISITRLELAQMSGTTLFAVSRLISRWSESGLLLPRREAVLVRDPKHFRMVCLDDNS